MDIQLALALDHRIKLVAAARVGDAGLSLRVHPALVHRGELLADVDSEFNAIILEGPGFKELTFLGKGAGELPTGSAVLNDIVKLALGQPGFLPGFTRAGVQRTLADTSDLRLCYFLRLAIQPGAAEGVLSALAKQGWPVLSHALVTHRGRNYLGVITDVMEEKRMLAMLPACAKASGVTQAPKFLRLDKDNYRDIVEREQSTYFGSSLKREPGARV